MKRVLILTIAIFLVHFAFAQQTIEGVSNKLELNITKAPPVLSIVVNSLKFTDTNSNNCIDANENCKISFVLQNSGYGDGVGLNVSISTQTIAQGISFSKSTKLSTLKIGEKQTVEIPIVSNMETADGNINFLIKVDEPNGFGTDMSELEVNTFAFVQPFVKVVDYSVTGAISNNLLKKSPFDLQILVQNTKHGLAENVKVNLKIPENVICVSGNETKDFSKLTSGETQDIAYTLIVSDNYQGATIPITINISEKYGKFSENKSISLNLNQVLSTNKIVVDANIQNKEKEIIIEKSLTSDIDKNIPKSIVKYPNRYALIIGNEDYSSRQTSLGSESNVAFAVNDAKIFKEYCINTFGLEERHVYLLTNATSGEMSQKIELIKQILTKLGSEGELIFYYAGHGFPDENSKEPYLIPVDVVASNLNSAIKLNDIYSKFSSTKASRITIFLDACFTGGGRDAGLMAARGVKIAPKTGIINGNLIVYAATSEDQSALPYKEKQHGIFTYFLLKKIQETNGDATYSELETFIKDKVSFESLKVNQKPQDPKTIISSDIDTGWKEWKLK